jgi:biotin carboxyl carrier protein
VIIVEAMKSDINISAAREESVGKVVKRLGKGIREGECASR